VPPPLSAAKAGLHPSPWSGINRALLGEFARMPIEFFLGLALMAQASASTPSFTLATCDDPAARKAMLAAEPEQLPMFKAMKDRAAANEARMTRLIDRLAERAKLTEAQKADIAMGMLEAPVFKAAFEEGMVLVGKMMESVTKLTGKDDAANCRIVIGMMDDLPAIEANARRQWDAMQQVLDGEAKKRGVSLAD
jgi:hypothetical protein